MSHNKEQDLEEFSDEIKSVLEERIVEQYYLIRGNFEASFDNDAQVKSAVSILQDLEKYNSMLTVSAE